MPHVDLRPVEDRDYDALFEMMRDPEAVWMAAFTATDPDDREDFNNRLTRHRNTPDITLRAVLSDGVLVGSVSSFLMEGDIEVSYWIDRAAWGRGIATAALRLLLREVTVRPVFARAAADNAGSLRVLRKCGFEIVGGAVSFAAGRNTKIDEEILRLDG